MKTYLDNVSKKYSGRFTNKNQRKSKAWYYIYCKLQLIFSWISNKK